MLLPMEVVFALHDKQVIHNSNKHMTIVEKENIYD